MHRKLFSIKCIASVAMFCNKYRYCPVIILLFMLIYIKLFSAQIVTVGPLVLLKESSGGHTVAGDVLKLECTTTFHSRYVSIEWDKPKSVDSNSVKLQTVSNEDTSSGYSTTSRLTIDEAKVSHSGVYKCKVVHREWNYIIYSNELLVPVYNKGQRTLQFDQNTNSYVRLSNEIQVHIKAHPNISVVWLDKNNKTISNGPSSKYLVNVKFPSSNREFNYYTTLQFKNVTSEDYGRYKVMAKNEFEAKYEIIGAFMGGVLYTKLTMNNIDESTAVAEFKCTITGSEDVKLKWLYIPCNRSKCLDDVAEMNRFILVKDVEFYEVEAARSEVIGVDTITYLALNLSSFGFVACFPDYEDFLRRTPKLIFYIQNNFVISAQNANAKGYLYVEYQETVKILCAVSLRKYLGEVRWYHNGKNIDKEDRFYNFTSNKYESLDKILVQLSFDYMFENHKGNYSCEVLTRSGEIHSKTVTVVPRNQTTFHPQLRVKDLNNGHTVVGEDIRLMCEVVFYKFIPIIWEEVIEGEAFEIENLKQIVENNTIVSSTVYISTSEITINSTNSTYTLDYRCRLSNTNKYEDIEVLVYDKENGTITFEGYHTGFDGRNMQIDILLWAHPTPTIRWFSNTGEEILPNSSTKFQISSYPTNAYYEKNYETTLFFKNGLEVSDLGNYTVVAQNQFLEESYSVEVNMTQEVFTRMDLHEFYEENKTAVYKCSALGYPEPVVQWLYAECGSIESCLDHGKEYISIQELYNEKRGFQVISYALVDLQILGFLKCIGTNYVEEDSDTAHFLYFDEGFEIFVRDKATKKFINTLEFVGDTEIDIVYGISILNYDGEVECFLFDSKNLKLSPINWNYGTTTSMWETHGMYVSLPAPGDYYFVCNALTKEGDLKTRSLLFKTRERSSLYISKSNMADSTVEKVVNSGSNHKFYCYVKGFPTPSVKWYRNNQPVESSEMVQITNNSQVLEFRSITANDEGTYKCEASNGFQVHFKTSALAITNNFNWVYVLVPSLLLALVVILATVTIIVKLRKENKLIQELRLAGLAYFEKGDLENLNPELRIEDQAELLPYDKKWEISKENIKFGKQLGSGAFGVVFEAGIMNEENTKIVAVKTVSKHSDFDCVKALASELKIMGHLGKHLNIVNLLGGCTKNIIRKELYVIVEYCRFGNLLEYIQRLSENFIDQKDYESDEFNWEIGAEHSEQYPQNQNNASENYKKSDFLEMSDYKDASKFISSRDFLVWAFQTAKGMEYLGSRRIVHGDLAARNVLLTDDNVVKVSDFGLAKKMYQDNNYIKKKAGRLPVKWMAVESIGKGIFSIQSDVWSFGVVLWEIFSLAKTPYPAMSFDETFYKKLVDGYRMEPPKTATNTISEVILSCWDSDPLLRPSFTHLIEKLGSLLEEPVKSHYIEMSNNYMLMDKQQQTDDTEDYLTMLSVPTFENILSSSSHHVNDNVAEGEINSGYV